MIVEMRIYTVKPGSLAEFMKIYEEHGLAIQNEILGNMVGWYTNEVGDINQVIHMWGYDTFEDRLVRRKKMAAHPGWPTYIKGVMPLLVSQENKILNKAPWSP